MARVSAERAEEQTKSDDEQSVLEEDAARYSGAYFRSRGQTTEDLQRRVNQALEALGYDRKTVEDPGKLAALAKKSDSKTEALVRWVKKNLFANGKLRDDERLIVFTEYKETLFYLEQRLLQEGFDKNTLRLLYGGMNVDEFEAVKSEFEDRNAAVRLLLATDAASEGINMQECVSLGHPLRHPLVALEDPATQRACVPPRSGPGCERPLLPLRPGRGHGLPLLRCREGRADPGKTSAAWSASSTPPSSGTSRASRPRSSRSACSSSRRSHAAPRRTTWANPRFTTSPT